MQTAPNIIPIKRAEPSKINEKWLGKKLSFSLNGKRKKNIYLFSANTKNISSHVLKISAISLVLLTCEITDIFNTFDDIYLVFTSK